MHRIRWMVLVCVLLSSLAVAACGGGDDSDDGGGTAAATSSAAAATTEEPAAPAAGEAPQELVDAAEKEGKVVWYNSQSPEKADQVIKDFEAKYDVDVEALRLSGSQLSQRYTADLQAGNQPDAISVADPGFYEATAKEGALLPLTPENVPSVADYPPDAIRFDDTTALIGITPWRVIVNTDVTEEPPKTWDDVLKPEFKDQIVFPDPRIIPTVRGMTNVWFEDPNLGADFLTKFGQQNPTIVESAVPGIQSVAAGEKKILVSTEEGVATPLIDEGAPLETVLITPINGTEMFTGLSAEGPNPNAAKLLMNFLLSPEGQEAVNAPERVSPVEGTPNTAELPDGYVQADLKQAEANSKEIYQLLGLD